MQPTSDQLTPNYRVLFDKKIKRKVCLIIFALNFWPNNKMTQNWVKICKKYMTYLRNDPKTSISVYL